MFAYYGFFFLGGTGIAGALLEIRFSPKLFLIFFFSWVLDFEVDSLKSFAESSSTKSSLRESLL